jgi:hypothetical protein
MMKRSFPMLGKEREANSQSLEKVSVGLPMLGNYGAKKWNEWR